MFSWHDLKVFQISSWEISECLAFAVSPLNVQQGWGPMTVEEKVDVSQHSLFIVSYSFQVVLAKLETNNLSFSLSNSIDNPPRNEYLCSEISNLDSSLHWFFSPSGLLLSYITVEDRQIAARRLLSVTNISVPAFPSLLFISRLDTDLTKLPKAWERLESLALQIVQFH